MSNAKTLRTRIKSVNSTMHITKAMEIVASSKFKKAVDAMEKSRLYFNALQQVFVSLAQSREKSVYFTARPVKKTCLVVIAGDRGLAGGYNNNIFKLALSYAENKEVCIIPVGKKALEYFKRRNYEIYSDAFVSSEKMDIDALETLSHRLSRDFANELIDEIKVFHTKYLSILSQETVMTDVLPIVVDTEEKKIIDFSYEPGIASVLNTAVPQYISGMLNGTVTESFVCELSSRRNAMNSANKNAEEMIDKLNLEYNRARQSAITQEITEIVAGS